MLVQTLKDLPILEKKNVNFRGGGSSDFYINVKKAYGDPAILGAIAKRVWEKAGMDFTCVACSGYGGMPLATALSLKYGLKLTLVRNEKKDHGLGGKIDGYLPDGSDKILVVDDVLTSGHSLKGTLSVLEGFNVKKIVVVVKRAETDLDVEYLFTAEDFL
tara:strand:+ start:183 stop:662 length:480 start_codon:yes stop_codon:yes gene_type:complete